MKLSRRIQTAILVQNTVCSRAFFGVFLRKEESENVDSTSSIVI